MGLEPYNYEEEFEGETCGTLYGTNLYKSHEGDTFDMGPVSDELARVVMLTVLGERSSYKAGAGRWMKIARDLKAEKDAYTDFPKNVPEPPPDGMVK